MLDPLARPRKKRPRTSDAQTTDDGFSDVSKKPRVLGALDAQSMFGSPVQDVRGRAVMSELLNFILDHEDAFQSRARLTSLYSDFALSKSTNPDGYAANTAAWRSALERACRAGLTPSPAESPTAERNASSIVLQTGDELVRQLESRDLGQPLALGDVVDDATNHGHLIPLRLFLDSQVPLTTGKSRRRSWLPTITFPTPYDVAKWLLAQTGLFGSGLPRMAPGQFVVLRNIEEAANAILQHVAADSDTSSSLIYSLQTFQACFGRVLPEAPSLSPLDVTALLKYLSRDKNAISISQPVAVAAIAPSMEPEPLVIKFSASSTRASPLAITQQDNTIASLKTLSLNLSSQVDSLESRAAQLDSSLRTAIPKSASSAFEKTRALSLLRQKKAIEGTLQRRLDSRTQIEQTLTSIDDAVTNVEMTKAMEASAGVLEDLNKQVGGAEGVAQVMDRLADAKADSEEIGRVLQQDAGAEVDDASVEEEFEEMLKESQPREAEEPLEQRQQKTQEGEAAPHAALELPDVPATEPGIMAGPASREDAAQPAPEQSGAEGGLNDSFGDLSLRVESRIIESMKPITDVPDKDKKQQPEDQRAEETQAAQSA